MPREAAGEEETRANALRWNVVYNEKGERIPGIRFSPAFRIRPDGELEWLSVSVVPFPEEGEPAEGVCPHGNDPVDCDACYRDADFAYDAERERGR